MSKKKKRANKHDHSMSELDNRVAGIKRLFKHRMLFDQMSKRKYKKLNKRWRRAKPNRYEDLTKAQQRRYDKEHAKMYREAERERTWNEIREFLQIGIDIKSDDPNSDLFRTAKKLLDVVDRAETDPLSVSEYEQKKFCTDLDRYTALLKAEFERKLIEEEPPEIDERKDKFGFHKK